MSTGALTELFVHQHNTVVYPIEVRAELHQCCIWSSIA